MAPQQHFAFEVGDKAWSLMADKSLVFMVCTKKNYPQSIAAACLKESCRQFGSVVKDASGAKPGGLDGTLVAWLIGSSVGCEIDVWELLAAHTRAHTHTHTHTHTRARAHTHTHDIQTSALGKCKNMLEKLCSKYDNLSEVSKMHEVLQKVETVKLTMQDNIEQVQG